MPSPRPLATALSSVWFRWGPVAVLGVVVLVLAVVLRPAGVGAQRFPPVQVGVSPADPLAFAVGVRWPYDGMCPDEVRAVVREQRDRVVVRWVERRDASASGCAGTGITPGSIVYGEVHLLVPLGRRLVVTGQGRQLPVVELAS